MKILVIGSGGREHALAWKLAQSPAVTMLYAAPGNPGIAQCGSCLPLPALDPQRAVALANELDIDLTVVGPEAPLVNGIVDAFRAENRRIIGPSADAARLEGSKAFTKAFLNRYRISTGKSRTASTREDAAEYLDEIGYPVVLKADGLAAGKGVIIAPDKKTALEALAKLPPGQVVVEEFLSGEEISFIALIHQNQAIPLEATQDHKAIFDGDKGPNTGGMGAYCDGRLLTSSQVDHVMDTIIHPTLEGMAHEGTPYTGFLYAGLMMTADGPKVLEFNVRLGDPECQTLMHRMESDLLATLLDGAAISWKPDPSVCVVLAAHGYPGEVRTGDHISGIADSSAQVFHSGTRQTPSGIETAGGRVLGVTASGPNLPAAIANAYAGIAPIHFEGMQFRGDIGHKGLKRW